MASRSQSGVAMTTMRPAIARLLMIAAAASSFAACATLRVSSHVDRGIDFTHDRTFDWGPADALPAGDPRLDNDRYFEDQVEGAIEKQMAARGYERSASNALPTSVFITTRRSTAGSTSTKPICTRRWRPTVP